MLKTPLTIAVRTRSLHDALPIYDDHLARVDLAHEARPADVQGRGLGGDHPAALEPPQHQGADALGIADRIQDRKSTRLNPSHVAISYAVFFLKKKIL